MGHGAEAPVGELEAVDVWLLPDWLMGEPDWEATRSRATGPTWLVNMQSGLRSWTLLSVRLLR